MKIVLLNIGSVRKDGSPVPERDRAEVKAYALEKLAQLYGGSSSIDGEGTWLSATGLVREGNSYVWSFVTGLSDHETIADLAETIRDELDQESTMMAVLELSEGSTIDFV